jgi:hypothetical protein
MGMKRTTPRTAGPNAAGLTSENLVLPIHGVDQDLATLTLRTGNDRQGYDFTPPRDADRNDVELKCVTDLILKMIRVLSK